MLLADSRTAEATGNTIASIFEIPISQTNELHRPKLEILYEELNSIRAKIE